MQLENYCSSHSTTAPPLFGTYLFIGAANAPRELAARLEETWNKFSKTAAKHADRNVMVDSELT